MNMELTFKQWMAQVNREVSRIAGLSVYDLADQPFRDWYEDGLTPAEAAEETLMDEGFPF